MNTTSKKTALKRTGKITPNDAHAFDSDVASNQESNLSAAEPSAKISTNDAKPGKQHISLDTMQKLIAHSE